MAQNLGWYPISTVGILITFLYALVPPGIVYAQSAEILPEGLRMPLVAAMGFVVALMLACRYTNQKPFLRRRP